MDLTPLQRSDERRRLKARFRDVLVEAATHRDERQDIIDGPDAWPEMGWAAYERQQMRAAVDAERAGRGLPPADPETLLRIERSATGHSDYADQFAFGCARIAMGEPWTCLPG